MHMPLFSRRSDEQHSLDLFVHIMHTQQKRECRDYHVVSRDEVEYLERKPFYTLGTRAMKERVTEELRKREKYSHKYFKGRIDKRHRNWMKKLSNTFDSFDQTCMSLEDCIRIQRYAAEE